MNNQLTPTKVSDEDNTISFRPANYFNMNETRGKTTISYAPMSTEAAERGETEIDDEQIAMLGANEDKRSCPAWFFGTIWSGFPLGKVQTGLFAYG